MYGLSSCIIGVVSPWWSSLERPNSTSKVKGSCGDRLKLVSVSKVFLRDMLMCLTLS